MKKDTFLLGVFLLLLSQNLIAQFYIPQPVIIKSDNFDLLEFKKNELRILEDCGNNWTIEQVSSTPIIKRFHENNTLEEGMNYTCPVYWIYYRLYNENLLDLQLTTTTRSDKIELFTKDSLGKWKSLQTGQLVPRDERDGFKTIPRVIFTIKAGDTTDVFIKRIDTYIFNKTAGFNPSILTLKSIKGEFINQFDVVQGPTTKNVFAGFMLGVLFLLTIFNSSFYTVSKEKIYLYYVLFLICLGVGRYLDVIYSVFLPNFPYLYWYGKDLILLGHFIGLIQFIRYLLPIKFYYPKFDKLLLPYTLVVFSLAKAIFFLKAPLTFKSDAALSFLSELLLTSIYAVIPLTLILLRHKKDITKIFIFVAPVLLSWIAGTLFINALTFFVKINTNNSITKQRAITYNYLMSIEYYKNLNLLIEFIALLWLVSFFAWELIKRYNILRQEIARQETEKERLAKEKEIERNQLIESQKVDLERQVEERTGELKHSLETLKATQTQLIQKEKMASLGELTAGIAHEIQNPLNFVNNFSEVSTELVSELKEEAQAGRTEDVLAIADDLAQNLQKITHHGSRASAIVKGMLEHSRTSTGEKQPANLNALVDEYLKVAYQGLRAKDRNGSTSRFTCDLVTHFAPNLSKADVAPQEIGRVLLNLYNNAFYAVHQKQKTALADYHPTVTVSTAQVNGHIEIHILDNGTGIPDSIKAKIFQPFFTTKPTGEGTGLGLSLSYDIVTKGHGGTIEIESIEGQGSQFIIRLPV